MSKDEHHVVPDPNGGWKIERAGADRASGHFDTKQEAIDRAREISRNQNTELVIHDKDGRIARKDSHEQDPFPPRG